MGGNYEERGALWKKDGPKGEFLAGHITVNGEKITVVVLPNHRKRSEKHPDFFIFEQTTPF